MPVDEGSTSETGHYESLAEGAKCFPGKMRIPDASGETGKDEEKGEHGPPGLLVYI